MSDNFFTRLLEALAPKENRLVAAVAFVRTFRQGFTGSSIAAAGGGITLTAIGLAEVNWQTVAFAAIAVGIASLGAALNAYFSVLENGLSRKYTEAVVATIENSNDQTLQQAIVDAAGKLPELQPT